MCSAVASWAAPISASGRGSASSGGMANSGPIVGGASSAELATRSRRRRSSSSTVTDTTAGQQRHELVDGRFHRDGRIGREEPVAGGEHRSAQQPHRPGGGECSVVVTQLDGVAGVGHEHLELVVVLGGHVCAEIDRDAWRSAPTVRPCRPARSMSGSRGRTR